MDREINEIAMEYFYSDSRSDGARAVKDLVARVRAEERARLSEGIDVRKEAGRIDAAAYVHGQADLVENIVDLCVRVRAETEAVVTKREREICKEIVLNHETRSYDETGEEIRAMLPRFQREIADKIAASAQPEGKEKL